MAKPKYLAEPTNENTVKKFLAKDKGWSHLRVRRRAELLTLESGAEDDAIAHARLRRVGARDWRLEMPTHQQRWETTPFLGSLDEVLTLLTDSFGWTLESYHSRV